MTSVFYTLLFVIVAPLLALALLSDVLRTAWMRELERKEGR